MEPDMEINDSPAALVPGLHTECLHGEGAQHGGPSQEPPNSVARSPHMAPLGRPRLGLSAAPLHQLAAAHTAALLLGTHSMAQLQQVNVSPSAGIIQAERAAALATGLEPTNGAETPLARIAHALQARQMGAAMAEAARAASAAAIGAASAVAAAAGRPSPLGVVRTAGAGLARSVSGGAAGDASTKSSALAYAALRPPPSGCCDSGSATAGLLEDVASAVASMSTLSGMAMVWREVVWEIEVAWVSVRAFC